MMILFGFEVIPEFCYLSDMLSARVGCGLAAFTCCCFGQVLPTFPFYHQPLSVPVDPRTGVLNMYEMSDAAASET